MKKTIAMIMSVGMLAGIANADLLVTWTFASGNSTAAPEAVPGNEEITYGELSRIGLGVNTTSVNQFGANNWNGVGNGIQLLITVGTGYFIENAVFAGRQNASNTGPGLLQWSLNGSDVSGATISPTATVGDWSVNIGTLNEGVNTLFISASGTLNVTGGATATAGSVRILTNMTLNGDLTVVPEPGTMSLLALGALGLIVRRKMMA